MNVVDPSVWLSFFAGAGSYCEFTDDDLVVSYSENNSHGSIRKCTEESKI